MPVADRIQFIDAWQQATEKDREDARRLWVESGAIANEKVVAQRLPQLCVLARKSSGALIGITTAFLQRRLGQRFYVMRMFVDEGARRNRIGFQLLHEVVQVLEQRFVSGQDRSAIGILFELENPDIQRAHPEAIWPTTGFVYIGRTPHGDPVRVRYFQGAMIDQPSTDDPSPPGH